ncbi:MAG: hypothetical protein LBC93_06685 [Synergistaceae bacterium]|jgi:cell shape-determining protein MreD|nr:hypothetical protein [Synergistaceae bacterium]
MIHAVFWLVQDLLTVLTDGAVRVPEIFLLSLAYHLLEREREVGIPSIWTAFLGGLLWDLRWVGFPGFYALVYVVVVMTVLWAWNLLPAQGRTPLVVFLLFWAVQLFPAVLAVLVLYRGEGGESLFLMQQGYAVPISLLSAFYYCQRKKDKNA